MNKLLFKPVSLFLICFTGILPVLLSGQSTIESDYLIVGKHVTLDLKRIHQQLLQGALEKQSIQLMLPTNEDVATEFIATESSVMEEGLSDQFPEIKSFLVQGVQHQNWKGRIAISPFGLVAVVLTEHGTLIIEPTDRYNDPTKHRVYLNTETAHLEEQMSCGTHHKPVPMDVHGDEEKSVNCLSIGTTLRKYRIAIASSAEFTNGIGGGTLAGTNAIINERLNALNVIYENEIAVHFDLVATNNNIVFFDPVTDGLNPSTSPSDQRPLSAHSTITSKIGSANFDIGHAFYEIPSIGTGISGSGVAGVAVVCNDTYKGAGWSGTTANATLAFVMGIFAHEVGHQFGALHSFYGTDFACIQRTPGAGYEPGSGTTLMSYAGSCNTHNVLPLRSTNYFHISSLVAMNTFINTTTCRGNTSVANTPPLVTIPNDFTIPKGTPFELTGSATDAEDANLTYIWEEYDTDASALIFPSGAPNAAANSVTAPLFRSFDPTTSGNQRTFPKLSDVVGNIQTSGEILPQVARTIKMRLVVRDNHAGTTGQGTSAGGVTCEELSITVNASAGPFTVTSPNVTTTWSTGSAQTVNWNVASTSSFCPNVNIVLSTDGGYTYPYTIISNTPNDGSQSITVPSVSNTSQARVRVECNNTNAKFFDISNANITIQGGASPAATPTNVAATDGTFTDKVQITWTGTAGNYCRVYRSTTNSSGTATALGSWQTATSYDDLTAVSGTTYYYWVRAATDINGSNISAFSTSNSGFAAVPTATTPTNLAATDGTFTNKVQVTWTGTAGNYFRVYRNSTNSSGTATALGSWQTATSYDDLTAISGTTYYYWVRAATDINGNNISAFSTSNSGFAAVPTAATPTNVAATDGTFTDKVQVTWTGTAGNYFRVYRNTTNSSGTATALGSWQTATSYDDLTAVTDVTYYYWVRAATNSSGSNISAFSVSDSGFKQDCTPAEMNLTAPITGTVVYTATSVINASSSIEPGANATFQSGEVINLTAGFYAKPGSTLTCIIMPNVPRCAPLNTIEARTANLSTTPPSAVKCYPNPFSWNSTIEIELTDAQNVTIELYDLIGRRTKTIANNDFEAGNQQIVIDGSDLTSGAYWVIIKGKNWQRVEKLIRE